MSTKTNNIKSVSARYFSIAGKMSKYAFTSLCVATGIEVVGMLFDEYIEKSAIWNIALVAETLLISTYSFLTLASSIYIFKGSKLKINDVVDNAFGTEIGGNHSENYFDNDEIREGTIKLLYNTSESCFFSYRELKDMEWKVYACTLIPLAIFVIGVLLNRAEVIMAIFRITAIIVLIVKTVKFFLTVRELEVLHDRMMSTLKHKIGKVAQFNAESINYALEYETVMVWYGEKIPDKVYIKLNDKLTNEWHNLKHSFVVK